MKPPSIGLAGIFQILDISRIFPKRSSSGIATSPISFSEFEMMSWWWRERRKIPTHASRRPIFGRGWRLVSPTNGRDFSMLRLRRRSASGLGLLHPAKRPFCLRGRMREESRTQTAATHSRGAEWQGGMDENVSLLRKRNAGTHLRLKNWETILPQMRGFLGV